MRFVACGRAAVFVAAAFAAAGCSNNSEPHGSPVLTMVTWSAGGNRSVVWSATGGTVAPSAPPGGVEVDFVFDRRLDGARVEGPNVNPPVTVAWPDQAAIVGDPPFADQVLYNSEPLYGGQTAYVLLQPALPGFPSGVTVSFLLDHAGLTSAYGDPMVGPTEIDVPTDAFTATFRLPTADGGASVPSDFNLPILFSNRPQPLAGLGPHVTAQMGGAPLPISVSIDGANPTIAYASPASCLGGWPSAGPITVTVDGGASDGFGIALAAPASATFTATGGPSGIPDGGACAGG